MLRIMILLTLNAFLLHLLHFADPWSLRAIVMSACDVRKCRYSRLTFIVLALTCPALRPAVYCETIRKMAAITAFMVHDSLAEP